MPSKAKQPPSNISRRVRGVVTVVGAQVPSIAQLTLRDLFAISEANMDHAMALAYQLYVAGRLTESEIVCRNLIACDHRYWWPHSLHATVLRRLGRYQEALAAVKHGLKYEPRQPKLCLMLSELTIALARARRASMAAHRPETDEVRLSGDAAA